MLIVYGIKNCSTMKKCFDWLAQQQIAYEFFDYKKQTIDLAVLQNWVDQLGLDTVINKRGTTWRKLTDEQKALAEVAEDAIQLMATQPSMIKRPIITDTAGKVVVIGFDAVAYQAALQP